MNKQMVVIGGIAGLAVAAVVIYLLWFRNGEAEPPLGSPDIEIQGISDVTLIR